MSASSLIEKYGREVTLSRENTTGTIDSEGSFISGARDESSIKMSIQPLSGDEALRLPDGIRNKKVMKCYTTTEVICGDETNHIAPDLIIDGSTTYEVNDVQYYEGTILSISPHYRATLVRINPV